MSAAKEAGGCQVEFVLPAKKQVQRTISKNISPGAL